MEEDDELPPPREREHANDRPPNSWMNGQLHLYHCYPCDKPNLNSWVASGRCAHCGWSEPQKEPTPT